MLFPSQRIKKALDKAGSISFEVVAMDRQQYGDRFRIVNRSPGRCDVSELGGGLMGSYETPEEASRVFAALEAHDNVHANFTSAF